MKESEEDFEARKKITTPWVKNGVSKNEFAKGGVTSGNAKEFNQSDIFDAFRYMAATMGKTYKEHREGKKPDVEDIEYEEVKDEPKVCPGVGAFTGMILIELEGVNVQNIDYEEVKPLELPEHGK